MISSKLVDALLKEGYRNLSFKPLSYGHPEECQKSFFIYARAHGVTSQIGQTYCDGGWTFDCTTPF